MDQAKRERVRPAPLNWQTVETVRLNFVKVEVTKAFGRVGTLYSFRVSRFDKGRDSNYFRAPDDAGDMMEAIRRANEWVMKDRAHGEGT